MGYTCFSLSYRLVKEKENKFPAQIDDVQYAVRWIRANSAKFKINPTHVGALGASAGGHLSSLLGMLETASEELELGQYSSRVNAVVTIFGPSDLTQAFPVTSELNVQRLVNEFIGKPFSERPDLYRQASPILHIDSSTLPFLIFHGTADPFVPIRQSEQLSAALQKAGIQVTFIKFEGEKHGFENQENGRKFVEIVTEFLNRHLKASAST